MYTGTLIDDLFATVERAEAKAQDYETAATETWFATVQEDSSYESDLPGVA
jgi:hypothetical protein